jgi:hypothetical protein
MFVAETYPDIGWNTNPGEKAKMEIEEAQGWMKGHGY